MWQDKLKNGFKTKLMTINEAKNELEKMIMMWDGVKGIGVIEKNNTSAIEIAIEKSDPNVSSKINQLLTGSRWKGYDVIIVPTAGFKFQ